MTIETLKKAERLNDCLETLNEMKSAFENKSYPSINQVKTTFLSNDILTSWKELNLDFINECIDSIEKEFKEL